MFRRKLVDQRKGAKGPINIEWKIDNFLSLPGKESECYYSPTFVFGDSSWYLSLHPNGQKGHSLQGYIGIYVVRGDSGPPLSLTYSLFIKKTDGKEILVTKSKETFCEKGVGWGEARAIGRSKLIEQKSEVLPSGILTVICRLKCNETQVVGGIEGKEVAFQTTKCRKLPAATHNSKVLSDLEKLLPSDDFLRFLYCENVNNITSQNACSLYRAAAKYDIKDLKSKCVTFMKSHIGVDNFCDVVTLALEHGETDLINQATDFFAINMLTVVKTGTWQVFLTENPIQSNELIIKGLLKKAQIFRYIETNFG